MAEYTAERRREGLGFAEKLAQFAYAAPDADSKREIFTAVNSIRKRYGLSRAEKISIVFEHIQLGASTIADLVSETKLDKNDIYQITKDLELDRKVVFRNINAGEKGRPTVCIFPV